LSKDIILNEILKTREKFAITNIQGCAAGRRKMGDINNFLPLEF
jgi:hypothetical protein